MPQEMHTAFPLAQMFCADMCMLQLLASVAEDGTVRLWDVGTAMKKHRLEGIEASTVRPQSGSSTPRAQSARSVSRPSTARRPSTDSRTQPDEPQVDLCMMSMSACV